ncbi:MAG: T9SS type A sorting domain-containing protein, partial [Balneolaceae bacterium]|nr:T9SS type A sorting domain-containing protein [Balneolaceae bacterium]
VENRHRDPEDDGVELTIRRPDGTEIRQQFDNDDEAFVNQAPGFEQALEPGVLVGVDNYDWSLPGGLDRGPDQEPGTPDDRELNGGILIWHIDEQIINRQIHSSGVNANPERRGVDLEEADGAQDIGRPADGQNSDFVNGTSFDFWWAGNDASVINTRGDTLQLYENKFGPDTRPNSRSNSGGGTLFELYDFSPLSPVMTFRAHRTGTPLAEPVTLQPESLPIRDDAAATSREDPYWVGYPLSLSVYTSGQDRFLIIPTAETTYALPLSESSAPLTDFGTGPPQQPLLADNLVLAERPGTERITLTSQAWNGDQWRIGWSITLPENRGFISSSGGTILTPDFTDKRISLADGSELADLQEPQQRSAAAGGRYAVISGNLLRVEGTPFSATISPGSRQYTGLLQPLTGTNVFYLLEDDAFTLIEPSSDKPVRELVRSPGFAWPAMADVNGDGRLDILFVNRIQNRLDAVNINGAMLSGFPILPPDGSRFAGTPLIADMDGDQKQDLVILTQDSTTVNLHAFGSDGAPKNGFPLHVGALFDMRKEPVNPVISGNTLFAVSHTGDLKAWTFEALDSTLWSSRYGSEPYNKVTGRMPGTSSPSPVNEILVRSETYNWPNPARDETHIRYQTASPGRVAIKIITPDGRVVFDQRYDTGGGAPEEQRISTAEWGSGIYLARVTATVNDRTMSKLIKIAVVH